MSRENVEIVRRIYDAFTRREVDLEASELTDAGDRVFAVVHEHAVGRASEAPVQGKHFAVWSLTDGVARLQVFDDQEEALRAAGLSPG